MLRKRWAVFVADDVGRFTRQVGTACVTEHSAVRRALEHLRADLEKLAGYVDPGIQARRRKLICLINDLEHWFESR